jgi:hypothetical protein
MISKINSTAAARFHSKMMCMMVAVLTASNAKVAFSTS